MPVQIGIIDQDPIRLVTPLLDDRAVSRHMIFIGDINQHPMFEKLAVVLKNEGLLVNFSRFQTFLILP